LFGPLVALVARRSGAPRSLRCQVAPARRLGRARPGAAAGAPSLCVASPLVLGTGWRRRSVDLLESLYQVLEEMVGAVRIMPAFPARD